MIHDSERDWEIERVPFSFDLFCEDDERLQVAPLDGDILVSPIFGLYAGIRVEVHSLETEVAAVTPCGRKVLSLWQTNAFEVG